MLIEINLTKQSYTDNLIDIGYSLDMIDFLSSVGLLPQKRLESAVIGNQLRVWFDE